MRIKFSLFVLLVIGSLLSKSSLAQEVAIDESGIEVIEYDNLISIYDPFTDDLTVRSKRFNISYQTPNGQNFRMMPVFNGTKKCNKGLCGDFAIRLILEETSIIEFFGLSDRNFFEEIFSSSYPILFDEIRDNIFVGTIKYEEMGKMLKKNVIEYSDSTALDIYLDVEQYNFLKKSESTKVRIEGTVIEFGEEVKNYFSQIEKILNKESGQNIEDLKKLNNKITNSPYELKWEGDIERAPMVQPLPTNTSNSEAVVTVRFEVRPDGAVGRIIPLRKIDPELETEVMKTLRTWRFSRLPSGVPQQIQWGTITFRFVFD